MKGCRSNYAQLGGMRDVMPPDAAANDHTADANPIVDVVALGLCAQAFA